MAKNKGQNMFIRRMYELGYTDVTEFATTSGVELSGETCRRAMHEDRQNLGMYQVVILMTALEFTPMEIAIEMERRGDKYVSGAIKAGAKGVVLSSHERDVLDGMRRSRMTEYLHPIFMEIIKLAKAKVKVDGIQDSAVQGL